MTSADIAAGAATGAVAVGIWQVRVAVAAQKTLATFAHLRSVAAAHRAVRGCDPEGCRALVLGFYKDATVALSEDAARYLDFLTELDLLALAFLSKSVDRKIVLSYMKGLLRDPHAISVRFIDDLRAVTADTTTYEHLYQLVAIAREAE